MNNDHINITSILTHLDTVVKKNVCARCYAGTLPETLTEDVETMVVIDCGNSVRDYHAYGRGTVNIYMYARPIARKMNIFALSRLEKNLSKALRENKFDTEYYSVPNEVMLSGQGYDTTYNMHYLIKAIRILIINV